MTHEGEKSELRHSSREADEQGGATRCGAGGAKGGDRGKSEPAKRAPGAGPGKRVTGVGSHTASGQGKEEGEVHLASAPHRSAHASDGVLCARAQRRSRRRRDDVGRLREGPRSRNRGASRESAERSVSGAAVTTPVHPEVGRRKTTARGRRAGGQDRPESGDDGVNRRRKLAQTQI